MNYYYLPVFSTFLEALGLPAKHYKKLLKIGFPAVITGGLLVVSEYLPWPEADYTLAFLLGGLLYAAFSLALIVAIIGCHRIFIMDSSATDDVELFNWTGNEIKYAGWSLWIALCIALLMLPFSMIFFPMMSSSIDNVAESMSTLKVIAVLINIPAAYVVSRWSLVLPSCAIDRHGKSLSWAWGLSDGNGGRVMLLVGLLPLAFDLLINLLPNLDSVFYDLSVGALWLVVGVVEIGLLSLTYYQLIENENAPPTPAEGTEPGDAV